MLVVIDHMTTKTTTNPKEGITPMTALKPVYSRPSDDEPTPAPKRKHHPTTTGANHKRNKRSHQRAKQRARELRAENEKLHRRLAAIYDALTLD